MILIKTLMQLFLKACQQKEIQIILSIKYDCQIQDCRLHVYFLNLKPMDLVVQVLYMSTEVCVCLYFMFLT